MIIRRPEVNELERLKEIHEPLQDQFNFPDFSNISSALVAVHNDEIIGFGALIPITEAIIVLDQSKSRELRMVALNLLHEGGESEAKKLGATQMHIFVQKKSFLNYMKKRFGYILTKGTALVKGIK